MARSLFGGVMSSTGGVTREALAPEVSAALARTMLDRWPLPDADLAEIADAARVVYFDLDAKEGVSVHADLADFAPMSDATLSAPEALRAFARAGRGLAQLHARGVVHGDLRPEMVWVGSQNEVVLLVPSQRSEPGALLQARLHPGGASPETVAFAAPEVVARAEATPASDVYGLAAMIHARVSGQMPLGQVHLRTPRTGPMGTLAPCVGAALDQLPTARPPMSVLTAALDQAARAVESPPLEAAYRSSFATPPPPTADAQELGAHETSGLLTLLLLVGGFCAFVGAVMLVVVGWDVVGETGRVVMLAAMSAVAWLGGTIADRKNIPAGGIALKGVGALFAAVATGYAFYLMDDPGRLLLLGALTGGALVGGVAVERRAPTGGAALQALGTQLLWAVGMQAIHMVRPEDDAGAVSALAAVVTLATFGCALRRPAGGRWDALFGALAAVDHLVFAVAFGDYIRTGAVMGPAAYSLGVAGSYALLAGVAARRKVDAIGTPMAVGAVLSAATSVVLGLWVMSERWSTHALPATLWPYAVALAALPFVRARGPFGTCAALTAGGVVALAPTVQAMIRQQLPFELFAVGVGFALLFAAFREERSRAPESVQMAWTLAGLFGVVTAPSLRALSCIGRHGAEDELSTYLALVSVTSAGLLALSYAVTKRASARGAYWPLEIAALSQFYGLFTLQILAEQDPWSYPVIVAAVASALIALGAVTRRSVPLVMSAGALIVNGWIQYFIRLRDVFPLSVLLVGFGVALLIGGVLYEQHLRKRLTKLREWN